MNNFTGGFKKGGLKFGGKKKYKDDNRYEGRKDKGNRSSEPDAKQFSATCSECTKKCEVPFKPSPEKPVYCSACFGMKKSANETRDTYSRDQRSTAKPPRHDPSRGRNDDGIADLKRQITGLELKLNKILDLINPPIPSQKVPVTKKK